MHFCVDGFPNFPFGGIWDMDSFPVGLHPRKLTARYPKWWALEKVDSGKKIWPFYGIYVRFLGCSRRIPIKQPECRQPSVAWLTHVASRWWRCGVQLRIRFVGESPKKFCDEWLRWLGGNQNAMEKKLRRSWLKKTGFGWWFQRFFVLHLEKWGKRSILTSIFFRWVAQSPTRLAMRRRITHHHPKQEAKRWWIPFSGVGLT